MASRNALETLSEDTVYCFFFPTSCLNTGELQALCESLNNSINNLSVGYIWHRDEFRVHIPVCKENSELPPHLTSATSFGDNIEDEWFIVYLLLEISRSFPNLVIQVYDNDGEFLLIEAADYLPSWANPETTENRVFIFQDSIHLIPATLIDADTDIKVLDAIKVIADNLELTNSPAIYKAVMKRIDDYPQKVYKSIHRAVLNLPLDIATVLALKPSLISPIVNTYCSHDVIDAKACQNVKFNECITVQVKFTKCLYAMLTHSKFVKTIRNIRINENDKRNALGFKVTCGYEMIMSKLTGDIFSSKEFHRFLKSLTDNGYFKGNLEGSRDYKYLLNQAKDFFLAMECPINTQVCNQISQLMQTTEFIDMKESIRHNSPSESIADDNDDWLNVNPDQLNDMLNSRYGKQTKLKSDDILNSQTITSQLSNFFKQTSDFEGIETDIVNDDDDGPIQLNPDEFVNSLKKMMDFLSSGKDEYIDSDISDDDADDIDDVPMTEMDELDKELKDKLNTDEKIGTHNSTTILQNMIKSMNEEAGSSGPSSNILKTIGINKTDILDSDDDLPIES